MLIGDVGLLADIGSKVVESQVALALSYAVPAFQRGVKGQVQLPIARPDSAELIDAIVEELFVRGLGASPAKHQAGDVFAIDPCLRELATGKLRKGRQQVHHGDQFAGCLPGANRRRPSHDARHTHASLQDPALAAGERVVLSPAGGAVVRCKDHQRVVVDVQLPQRAENLADGPIDLLDHVAVDPVLRFPAEGLAGVMRTVRHDVRQVHEERFVLVGFDELDGLGGEIPGKLPLVRRQLDNRLVPKQRQVHTAVAALTLPRALPLHVVAVGDAVIVVKPLAVRHELRLIPNVPFPNARRAIALPFEQFGDRGFRWIQALIVSGQEHIGSPRTAGHIHAQGITACQ